MSVLAVLGYENLRNVRQCFYNLSILLELLPGDMDKGYLEETVRIFILLFLQKSQNKIGEGDTRNAIVSFLRYGLAYDEFLVKKKDNKDLEILFYLHRIPLEECWEGITFGGDYTASKILENYRKDTATNDGKEMSTLFYLLNHWRELNQKEFHERMDTLTMEYFGGTYLHPGEILHVANLMLVFSTIGILGVSNAEVVDQVGKGIDALQNRIVPVRDIENMHSYAGYGYSDDIADFALVRKKLREINATNLNRRNAEDLSNSINDMGKDMKAFARKILHINGDGSFYGVPILSLIDVNSLFSKLRTVSLDDQSLFVYALEERYGKKYSNSPFNREYYPDIENVGKLGHLYMSAFESILYDPQALQTKQLAERLRSLHEYMTTNKTP